ncbi:MAG: pyridoxamine 5'-phosphate oxidase family protein [Chitinophagaceae bacterium]
MATDINLQFIREKVNQLKTAVMYSMSESISRLPNDVVTAVKVDEEGQLWFLSRGPQPSVKEFEKSFPARLSFFRKGYDFFVEVSGKAIVVNDNYTDEEGGQRTLLVKMNMLNIEYTEPHTRKPKNKVEVMLENGYKWFLRTAAFSKNTSGSVLAKLHHSNYN